MLGTLEAFRPAASVLAAIDADPDADDPSVGLGGGLGAADRAAEVPATADAFAAWAGAQPASTSASLDLVSVYGGASEGRRARAGSVRVVLGLSELVRFESSEIAADGELPPRFVILLPATALGAGVSETTTVGGGGLARVRVSAEGPGARVTLDLEPAARATLFVLPEPFRIIVDVRIGSGGEEVVLAGAGPQSLDLLVLDPGHGGDDFGARAFGLEEQDITLDLATRVRDILRARLPSTRVVLTREENRFVSLEQRTAMANAVGADAFVSIHLNAAWEDVQHGGVTTFVLDTNDDRQAVRLAARENGTSEHEVGSLSRILAGLHRDEQAAGSRALAEHIHASTLAGGRRVLPRLYDRGVRSAMFYVLVGATMPAVLVEASFMTRRDEADALRTEGYRQSLAEGIADGIVAYARGDAAPQAEGAR
jgi:N-acetylmuramoyl-L-alanine amidase